MKSQEVGGLIVSIIQIVELSIPFNINGLDLGTSTSLLKIPNRE